MRKDYLIGANSIRPDYFCITPLNGVTEITWNVPSTLSNKFTMQYSTDKLEWINCVQNQAISTSVPIYFRGNNTFDGNDRRHITLSVNKSCDLSGRVATLCSKWGKSHPFAYGIRWLWSGGEAIPNTWLHSVKNLIVDISLKRDYDPGTLQGLFKYCTNLIDIPKFNIIKVNSYYLAYDMFEGCSNLEELPILSIQVLNTYCYTGMFSGCRKIKLSTVQTGDYQYEYRIPSTGTGTIDAIDNPIRDMFNSTGGTFTGTPTINTTYYTSNRITNELNFSNI